MEIRIHGAVCQVCGFDFDEVCGRPYADSYIETHHVRPLSEHEGEMDPTKDLVPHCAICHRMTHKWRTTVTSIEERKALIEEANRQR